MRFAGRDLSGNPDVEQMDLVVFADALAVGREQQRGVVAAPLPLDPFGDRPGLQMNAELTRERGEPFARRSGNRLGELGFRAAWPAPVEDLRQHDEVGALL